MYRPMLVIVLLFAGTSTISADPTRPVAGNLSSSASSPKQQTPTLEAIIKKGDTHIAVIDGQLTTEAYATSALRVKRIFADRVDIEYSLNGVWTDTTLRLTTTSFTKKSTTKIE